jgi:hypothetical protein
VNQALDFSAPPPEATAFRDVREEEQEILRNADRRIATLKAALSMADGVLQMASSVGFKQFVQALHDMRQTRMRELFSARNDRDANIFTGRVLEIEAVINVVDRTSSTRESLARELAGAEDAKRQIERRIPPAPQNKEQQK